MAGKAESPLGGAWLQEQKAGWSHSHPHSGWKGTGSGARLSMIVSLHQGSPSNRLLQCQQIRTKCLNRCTSFDHHKYDFSVTQERLSKNPNPYWEVLRGWKLNLNVMFRKVASGKDVIKCIDWVETASQWLGKQKEKHCHVELLLSWGPGHSSVFMLKYPQLNLQLKM